jgi:hypothetical protein
VALFGLSHGDLAYNTVDVDYGFTLGSGNTLKAEENANWKGQWSYQTGDRPHRSRERRREGSTRTGDLLYTSTTPPTLPLRVDTSMQRGNSTLFPVAFVGSTTADTLEPPVFSPGPGTYSDVTVTIVAEAGATIHYTTDGTDRRRLPPCMARLSSWIRPRPEGEVLEGGIVRQRSGYGDVHDEGGRSGDLANGGTYSTPQSVVISEGLAGADIHYTTNGVDRRRATRRSPRAARSRSTCRLR